MGERAAAILVAAVGIVCLAGCEGGVPAPGPLPAAAPLQGTVATRPIVQIKDWTNPKRPPPVARNRSPFKFGEADRRDADAPIPNGVSPESLPELPLPLPAADLRLIGIAGTDDGLFTAVVTIGDELILAGTGDTIASRYRVVAVGEDAFDVIDAVGDQPRRMSLW